MDEKQATTVGDRIDYLCMTCGEERGHVVTALGKKGQVTRIRCPMCDTQVVCRTPVSVSAAKSRSGSGVLYDQARTYRKGEALTHHLFGAGQVTALVQPRKMDVLFADRLRRLVCGNQ